MYAGQSNALICDGYVDQVLSGNAYCQNGQRVGFIVSGVSNWLCSSNKNMDALILTAYTTGAKISIRDSSWTSCTGHNGGTAPNHVWLLKLRP